MRRLRAPGLAIYIHIQGDSQRCYCAYYLYDVYESTVSTKPGDDVYYAWRR
jgi:hypothetical protein